MPFQRDSKHRGLINNRLIINYCTFPDLFHIIITVIFITTTLRIKITVRKPTNHGSIHGRGKVFCSPKHQTGSQGPHVLLFNRNRGSFSQGIKRPGCEVGNSHPYKAKHKNMGPYSSITSIRLHGGA